MISWSRSPPNHHRRAAEVSAGFRALDPGDCKADADRILANGDARFFWLVSLLRFPITCAKRFFCLRTSSAAVRTLAFYLPSNINRSRNGCKKLILRRPDLPVQSLASRNVQSTNPLVSGGHFARPRPDWTSKNFFATINKQFWKCAQFERFFKYRSLARFASCRLFFSCCPATCAVTSVLRARQAMMTAEKVGLHISMFMSKQDFFGHRWCKRTALQREIACSCFALVKCLCDL